MNKQIVELKEQTRKQIMWDKAQQIAEEGKVIKVGIHRWHVMSSSKPGLVYEVAFSEELAILTCTCPHYEHRSEYCKHILSVACYFGMESKS